MVELIRQQRHFLQLLLQTTSAQRKALLHTITKQQLRALCQIAYNILKFKIPLTPSERTRLKRQRRFVYLLSNRKIGYQQKKVAIRDKQRLIYMLVKTASTYLESVLQ
jgi:hypothetical protein